MRTLPIDLVGQFILCRSEAHLPARWTVRRKGDWWLAAHPTLPVIALRDARGKQIGWLLGYAIHPEGYLLTSAHRIPSLARSAGGSAQFQDALYALGGRFVAIHWATPEPHVYLDPCGSLAVVFSREDGIVASSPNLIPYSRRTRDNDELIRAIGVRERDSMYRFGLTPRDGVARLLPNHMLDLSTWVPGRHWPGLRDLTVDDDIPAAVSGIGGILERQIGAIARATPIYLSLTGGRHTRMLLACARPSLARISLFTIPVPDALGTLDLRIARQIVHRFGLRHLDLKWEDPSEAEQDEWVYRTGACVAGRTLMTVRTLRQLDPARCIFSGMFGGVADPRRWRESDFQRRSVSPTELLDRLGVPAMADIVARAEQWFERLPAHDIFSVLSLLHLEQNYGSWGGPQEYGHVRCAFILSPYCHRRIMQLMLKLPPRYRWLDRLPKDLIAGRWPQLLDVPFNAPVGVERMTALLKRAVRGGNQHFSSVRRRLTSLKPPNARRPKSPKTSSPTRGVAP